MGLRTLVLLAGLLASVSAFRRPFEKPRSRPEVPLVPGADYGTPLFLTPYIQQGQLAEAKNLSLVGPLAGTTRTSYTGYLTVDPLYNSNLFFWYFPAENNPTTAPVVMWLQGGPGSSSMFGLFGEMGPFAIDAGLNLYERNFDWATNFNLVFFDNPVGAGFSFTDDPNGYANNQDDVAADLYEGLQQFFTLFSELQPLNFYPTGESYGGKYVPAITYKIIQSNPTATLKINLKGMAVGNGWIDPLTQFDYGDYLYNVGYLDSKQRQLFYEEQIAVVNNINLEEWIACNVNSDNMMSLYEAFSGNTDVYNYLYSSEPADYDYYYDYLQKPEVRKSIHVGNLTFSDGNECYTHLLADICQSTKPRLESILDSGLPVMLYNGQMDIICDYYLQMNMVYSLNWVGVPEYRAAKRNVWRVNPTDREIAGYVKEALNFYDVLVRNGGHILPYDQPPASFAMINRFVFNQSFVV